MTSIVTLQSPINSYQDYVSGYYQVGSEIFVNKTVALIRGSETKIFPTWHFHSDVYSHMLWHHTTSLPLDDLYRQRALQLRDNYDFISLSFSGGADSYTSLMAFLDNNIFIDEIFVRWPIKATADRHAVSRDPQAANILSEWHLTILPMLDQLQNRLHPNTKLTIVDWSARILQDEVVDTHWAQNQDFFNPGFRIKLDTVTDSARDAIEKGKRTALLFGVDKPQLCVRNGHVYCYFLDKLAHSHAHHPWDQYCELFYWTKDMPEIVVAQCQMIYQHLVNRPALADLIQWGNPYNHTNKTLWDKIVGAIIYPGYSSKWFQAEKPSTLIFAEVDAWMYNYHDLRFMQSWKYVIKNHMTGVDTKFIEYRDNKPIGYVGFFDQMYHLGPMPVSPAHSPSN